MIRILKQGKSENDTYARTHAHTRFKWKKLYSTSFYK